ncbi:D-glycero-alpha-D-manno-heptose-1,7-bisphosphate 7-phosphatase [Campylobacter sp. RM16192]|uniref:D-glycero-alpha-D-manno-heptose-1,7-bisphosphate 7-phosphatase n=1 Tax=Campylobacter sp. RM16192 TaxID=1660080 RepID=UPI001555CD89|nr:HAD family hydrolase [Campylobacter sp. RM16192]
MNNTNFQKALFLDRDGVINEDFGYVYDIDNFIFKPDIFNDVKNFVNNGFIIVVVTNQSGIGRGYYTLEQFNRLSEFMLREFKKNSINISKICFCPHAPEADCECRKPKPKMITDAAKELNIDLKKSIMIGDKDSDIKAAETAGVGMSFMLDGVIFKSVGDVFKSLKDKEI